jgi:hypothetical protein
MIEDLVKLGVEAARAGDYEKPGVILLMSFKRIQILSWVGYIWGFA